MLEALLLPGRVAQPWNNYYDDLTTLLRRKQEGTHDWAGTPPLNSMRVAEIGTMYGGASERILQQLPKVTEHFAIDLTFLAGYDDNDMTSVKLGRFAREKNATREQFSRAWADAMAHDFWAHFGCRYHLLHAKSLDAAPRFADGSLDVAFIDARPGPALAFAHARGREGAADDIAAWWPKLKPNGGLMVLNDYGTRIFPGVKTAAHAFFGPRGLAVKVGRRGKPPGQERVRREARVSLSRASMRNLLGTQTQKKIAASYRYQLSTTDITHHSHVDRQNSQQTPHHTVTPTHNKQNSRRLLVLSKVYPSLTSSLARSRPRGRRRRVPAHRLLRLARRVLPRVARLAPPLRRRLRALGVLEDLL